MAFTASVGFAFPAFADIAVLRTSLRCLRSRLPSLSASSRSNSNCAILVALLNCQPPWRPSTQSEGTGFQALDPIFSGRLPKPPLRTRKVRPLHQSSGNDGWVSDPLGPGRESQRGPCHAGRLNMIQLGWSSAFLSRAGVWPAASGRAARPRRREMPLATIAIYAARHSARRALVPRRENYCAETFVENLRRPRNGNFPGCDLQFPARPPRGTAGWPGQTPALYPVASRRGY